MAIIPVKTSHVQQLENQELINLLIERGYQKLVDVLLDPNAYCNSSDRLNVTKIAKMMRRKPHQIEKLLKEARAFLEHKIK